MTSKKLKTVRAAVDAANGQTKGAGSVGSDHARTAIFPSVRATATGDSLGLGAGLEMRITFYDFEGGRYVLGADALDITRKGLERHMGADRYGSTFHRFLVATALVKMFPELTEGAAVDLTLFAPPGLYKVAGQRMRSAFAEPLEIQLPTDKRPRVFTIQSLTIWPEGLGAIMLLGLDERGARVATGALGGETATADFGVYTLDWVITRDGLFNPESLARATYADAGVNAHLREPLLALAKRADEEFSITTVEDIDRVLCQGLALNYWVLESGNAAVDLKDAVAALTRQYGEWVGSTVIDSDYNGLRGVRRVFTTGGGAPFVEKYLALRYPGKFQGDADMPHVAHVPHILRNAAGGLRVALHQNK